MDPNPLACRVHLAEIERLVRRGGPSARWRLALSRWWPRLARRPEAARPA